MADLTLETRWMVYGPEYGVEFYATEAEAVDAAANLIDSYLDDTWSEGVEGVYVAHVTHWTEERGRIDNDDPDWEERTGGRTDVEFYVNYEIVPVPAHLRSTP